LFHMCTLLQVAKLQEEYFEKGDDT